jgi:5,10-methylenetetrahydromethanopterin reductase
MVRFGLELVPMDPTWKTIYHSIHAEKANFDYLWFTDHFYNRNLWVTLSLAAAYTSRIKLGPAATNPYLSHPVLTVQAINTLSEMAPGRVVCGVGQGDRTTLEMIGAKQEKSLQTLRNFVQMIRAGAAGDSIKIRVKNSGVSEARLLFHASNVIPIYIGAQGPKALALAGEVADGVSINSSHEGDVGDALRKVENGLERASRRKGAFDFAAYTIFSVHEDPFEAEKAALPAVAFIVAGSPPSILERHGVTPEKALKIRRLIAKERWDDALSLITPAMIETFSICGTTQNALERLNRLVKLGITQIVFGSPVGPSVRRSIELIRRDILPAIR